MPPLWFSHGFVIVRRIRSLYGSTRSESVGCRRNSLILMSPFPAVEL
jgi:hypothetical protein